MTLITTTILSHGASDVRLAHLPLRTTDAKTVLPVKQTLIVTHQLCVSIVVQGNFLEDRLVAILLHQHVTSTVFRTCAYLPVTMQPLTSVLARAVTSAIPTTATDSLPMLRMAQRL